MKVALAFLALLILASAAAAVTRRNLIHSALLLVGTWFGIAAFYLWAGAEFVAFGQILVYGGAVSMVVLFAVLLTRRAPENDSRGRAMAALGIGAAVFAILAGAVLGSDCGPGRRPGEPTRETSRRYSARSAPGPTTIPSSELWPDEAATAQEPLTVHALGLQLIGSQAAAVLAIGALLTVALLGAVVLAAAGGKSRPDNR